MKKIIAILLCAVMLVFLLAGCTETDVNNPPPTGENSAPPTDSDDNSTPDSETDTEIDETDSSPDFDAAFTAFSPDTVIMRAADTDVLWGEFFYYLRDNVNYLLSVFGEISDWNDILYEDVTFADSVISASVDNALFFKSVEYGAALTGVTLGDAALASLRNDIAQMEEHFGGEEEFIRLLWEEDGFYSRELFEHLMSISYLIEVLFTELFGESGESLPDEDVAELSASEGYLMAKHILIQPPDDSDDDREDNALEEIESVLSRLNSYRGSDFDAFFDELMFANSADSGGLIDNPGGYLFQDGDMTQSFHDAAAALEIGEVSEIIESDHGFHIIYRLPLDYDAVPFSLYSRGDFRSLRHISALTKLEMTLNEWKDILVPEFTDNYHAIDIDAMFAE